MSRGPMESNKEEMRVAEVVEEVVDSMEGVCRLAI